MDYFKSASKRTRHALSTDTTLNRTARYSRTAVRAFPSAAGQYLVERVPVVHWLPKYNPRWLLNDVLAGVTVGVLLIPQSLAYAKIATIPGEYGLMSSWLPNFLVFMMGTSKDLSTGPTSLMGLLTAEIIRDISSEGYSPQVIASAVAMSVGIYALTIGMLKLGFLLEFISIPVLNGFISAAGIVIMLGQIPSLFGITVRTGTANIIHDIFAMIPQYDGPTVGIGLGGLVLLVAMQKMGQRWGKTNKAIWLLALGRSALVLILFTGISYGVNKDRASDPVWALSKVKSNGINAPRMPSGTLIQKVFARSVAPFIAAAIEHLAIAKAFGRKNDYIVDPAQELVYLGFTNFFNSFFSSMPVGGAMSRTAVNSDSGVKSPAYGLIAGGVVILSIFKLSPALYWIPKATLAAIIVTAVWHVVVPPKVFYGYWKTSLVDFITAMLAFWLTLFVSSEVGIGAAVGFNIVYHLLFMAFHRVHRITRLPPTSNPHSEPLHIPIDTQVFAINQPILFFNAFHIKNQCLDAVQTYNSGTPVTTAQLNDRTWSVAGARRAIRLRRKADIEHEPVQIRTVVLDLSKVYNVDATGLTALQDFVVDVQRFAGKGAEVRFVGLNPRVRDRFARFGWSVVDFGYEVEEKGSVVYASVEDAVVTRRRAGSDSEEEVSEVLVVDNEKV
ncbi:sulfate permease [Dothidotthia symphoricarpi CBS 119687]|uniref:Sulfate permease n=1 Tax=Dothidotthia symphoricarpi CBS 119687 TaxID=1392245 RepID=A0A6A6ACL9_9PLEO|nr:sulfate permease [Dothidotthia symphoricarpi CBS 119687]KAF2129652.1 sulfate permease [Dothidotthia symphoricarpi CBS 119687]